MITAALAFTAAAALLTIAPGLDSMFVVRTAVASGRRVALVGGLGVCLGTLCWACASAGGIAAILLASDAAYTVLRVAGAAYLTYVGVRTIWRTRPDDGSRPDDEKAERTPKPATSAVAAFRTGLATNLLNPKVGAFYLTLLPQFVPAHAPVFAFSVLLAAIHAAEGIVWFAILAATATSFRRLISRPRIKRAIDRVTGAVFVGFGVRLALESRRLAVR